ncbi:MAG: hypothetical protein GEU78_10590 [Actinobacteria bacterium]|nr:hypothetical protein [Actinomycetota bacterium]
MTLAETPVGQGAGLLIVDMTRALADPAVVGRDRPGPTAAEHCRRVLDAARSSHVPVWFSRGGKIWHTSTGNRLTDVERGGWLRKNGWTPQSPDLGNAGHGDHAAAAGGGR